MAASAEPADVLQATSGARGGGAAAATLAAGARSVDLPGAFLAARIPAYLPLYSRRPSVLFVPFW